MSALLASYLALSKRQSPNGGLPVDDDTTSDGDEPGPTAPELSPEVEELWSSRALLIVLLLLILSFWVSYYLKVRRIRSIHETIVALFSGMLVGAIIRLAPGNVVQSMIAFKSTILLNVLLPPIILNSGFQLKQDNFFRNFAVILTFAFAGTFISAVTLGALVYVWTLIGLEGLSLTIVECLLFGSTLSATDPVTILAIFNSMHVDPKLYSVIMGESLLNDAVAIVMFETLSQFHGEKIHVLSFFHGTGIFLLTFCISMALGVMFGLGGSLMLKHSELGRFHEIESCLVTLLAYTSYFFSNALTMSGIVSLLFCGITLKHYAYHNMSPRTQRTTRYMFGILAQLSENFIFIYLGLSLFTSTRLVYKPVFILFTAIAVCIARYAAVFPISKLINFVVRARSHAPASAPDELPHSYQMMLFWAGLRGAVGVALAAGITGENAGALRTTVLVVVVLTVVVFGGTIGRMIEILGIRTGVEDDDDDSSSVGDAADIGGGADVHHMLPTSVNSAPPRPASAGGDLSHSHHYSHWASTPDDVNGTPKRSMGDSRRTSRLYDDAGYARRGTSVGDEQYGTGASSSSVVLGSGRTGRPRRTHSNSSSAGDSDPDITLPRVESDVVGDPGDTMKVWRDGQWFNVLDERYLLPVFSNTTASRRQASRKASRVNTSGKRFPLSDSSAELGGADDDTLASPGGIERPYSAPGSPYHSTHPGPAPVREYQGSFTDILTELVSSTASSPGANPSPTSGAGAQRHGSGSRDE